jgi:integration host factor subunit beta
VTKSDIVKTLADNFALSQVDARKIVQGTFDAIVNTLVEQGRIELRNFGVFEVKTRRPRRARNPRTGEPVEVPARRVVTFKPGRLMEGRIR